MTSPLNPRSGLLSPGNLPQPSPTNPVHLSQQMERVIEGEDFRRAAVLENKLTQLNKFYSVAKSVLEKLQEQEQIARRLAKAARDTAEDWLSNHAVSHVVSHDGVTTITPPRSVLSPSLGGGNSNAAALAALSPRLDKLKAFPGFHSSSGGGEGGFVSHSTAEALQMGELYIIEAEMLKARAILFTYYRIKAEAITTAISLAQGIAAKDARLCAAEKVKDLVTSMARGFPGVTSEDIQPLLIKLDGLAVPEQESRAAQSLSCDQTWRLAEAVQKFVWAELFEVAAKRTKFEAYKSLVGGSKTELETQESLIIQEGVEWNAYYLQLQMLLEGLAHTQDSQADDSMELKNEERRIYMGLEALEVKSASGLSSSSVSTAVQLAGFLASPLWMHKAASMDAEGCVGAACTSKGMLDDIEISWRDQRISGQDGELSQKEKMERGVIETERAALLSAEADVNRMEADEADVNRMEADEAGALPDAARVSEGYSNRRDELSQVEQGNRRAVARFIFDGWRPGVFGTLVESASAASGSGGIVAHGGRAVSTNAAGQAGHLTSLAPGSQFSLSPPPPFVSSANHAGHLVPSRHVWKEPRSQFSSSLPVRPENPGFAGGVVGRGSVATPPVVSSANFAGQPTSVTYLTPGPATQFSLPPPPPVPSGGAVGQGGASGSGGIVAQGGGAVSTNAAGEASPLTYLAPCSQFTPPPPVTGAGGQLLELPAGLTDPASLSWQASSAGGSTLPRPSSLGDRVAPPWWRTPQPSTTASASLSPGQTSYALAAVGGGGVELSRHSSLGESGAGGGQAVGPWHPQPSTTDSASSLSPGQTSSALAPVGGGGVALSRHSSLGESGTGRGQAVGPWHPQPSTTVSASLSPGQTSSALAAGGGGGVELSRTPSGGHGPWWQLHAPTPDPAERSGVGSVSIAAQTAPITHLSPGPRPTLAPFGPSGRASFVRFGGGGGGGSASRPSGVGGAGGVRCVIAPAMYRPDSQYPAPQYPAPQYQVTGQASSAGLGGGEGGGSASRPSPGGFGAGGAGWVQGVAPAMYRPDSQYPAPRYQVIFHEYTFRRLNEYRVLLAGGTVGPGGNLGAVLRAANIGRGELSAMSVRDFANVLMQTRHPCIFAERDVFFNGEDWTREEGALLGDMAVAMNVKVWDDGQHNNRHIVHPSPFYAQLIYVSAPLLRVRDRGDRAEAEASPDYASIVTQGGEIDQAAYNSLIELRVLPGFGAISLAAQRAGKKAIVVVPGLGCGQFAGDFLGRMQEHLNLALRELLRNHHGKLQGIAGVVFDGYMGDQSPIDTIGGIKFVQSPGSIKRRGLLSHPSLFARELGLPEGPLAKFVAWDHCSYPGNDYIEGRRETDDGVTCAATDTCKMLTGADGTYRDGMYMPPSGFNTWKDYIERNRIPMGAQTCYVMCADGLMYQLEGDDRLTLLPDHSQQATQWPSGASGATSEVVGSAFSVRPRPRFVHGDTPISDAYTDQEVLHLAARGLPRGVTISVLEANKVKYFPAIWNSLNQRQSLIPTLFFSIMPNGLHHVSGALLETAGSGRSRIMWMDNAKGKPNLLVKALRCSGFGHELVSISDADICGSGDSCGHHVVRTLPSMFRYMRPSVPPLLPTVGGAMPPVPGLLIVPGKPSPIISASKSCAFRIFGSASESQQPSNLLQSLSLAISRLLRYFTAPNTASKTDNALVAMRVLPNVDPVKAILGIIDLGKSVGLDIKRDLLEEALRGDREARRSLQVLLHPDKHRGGGLKQASVFEDIFKRCQYLWSHADERPAQPKSSALTAHRALGRISQISRVMTVGSSLVRAVVVPTLENVQVAGTRLLHFMSGVHVGFMVAATLQIGYTEGSVSALFYVATGSAVALALKAGIISISGGALIFAVGFTAYVVSQTLSEVSSSVSYLLSDQVKIDSAEAYAVLGEQMSKLYSFLSTAFLSVTSPATSFTAEAPEKIVSETIVISNDVLSACQHSSIDLLHNSTAAGNNCVGDSLLESSCTFSTFPFYASESSSICSPAASSARGLTVANSTTLSGAHTDQMIDGCV